MKMKANNPVKILLVDDLPENLFALEIILSNKNYICVKANSGNEALKILLHEQDFALILMDVQMPEMDGFETVELIHEVEILKHIPVIFLTASMANSKQIYKGYQTGAVDYMIKPLNPEILKAKVAAIADLYLKTNELLVQNEEKEKRAAELIIANKELAFQNEEKEKRAAELIIANKELVFQNEEKEKRAAELVIANKELVFQNEEKEKRAAELVIANKELVFQNEEKEKRAAELVIAKEKAEESDQLKTAFLHNISHEIRTPISAIVGFSGFLKDPELRPEKRNNFADIVIKSSEQLLSIITDIISIATIEAGQQKIHEKEINLNSNIQLLYSQYITKATHLEIKLDFNTTLPNNEAFIKTDGTKLLEILSNLIGNSLKFIKQGSIEFGYHLKENMLEFYVKDTGIGIPKEMQEIIFDRFRQVESGPERDYGGSGLGLSISKSQVELLGGKIWLNSELGKGSTFYFTIPYHKSIENNSSKKELETTNVKVKKTKTLLIAEDEENNFLLLTAFLTDANITVLWAKNGLQAVKLFKENPQIDLILMDIKMPKMGGYEATKIIRELNPQIPVIAQTAYSTDSDKNEGIQFGFNEFLIKPINRHLFLSKINDYLYKLKV